MGFMSLAALIIALVGFGEKREVSVELFSRDKKVIPLCYEHGDYRCIHAKPPQVVIRNLSQSAVTVKQAELIGRAVIPSNCLRHASRNRTTHRH